jgi:hypothetical protein
LLGGLATVDLDVIAITELGSGPPGLADMASKWGAVDGALSVIRGIDGWAHGFKTNLEGRAYSRFFTPADDSAVVRPYVCVPLDQVFPKQISFFGTQLFDPSKTYEHTTVFRYEL